MDSSLSLFRSIVFLNETNQFIFNSFLNEDEYPRMEFSNQTYIGLENIIECIKKEVGYENL